MSFREIAISIRAVNRASHEFARIQSDAESLTLRIRTLGFAMAGLGSAGSAVVHLAHSFGLLNAEQTRVLAGFTYLITTLGVLIRSNYAAAIAHKVYAAACWIANAAQSALNINFVTFLALTGVGIAAIIAAAAAVSYFASQMRSAAESVREYNEAASETYPGFGARTVRRAGELELIRRGVE